MNKLLFACITTILMAGVWVMMVKMWDNPLFTRTSVQFVSMIWITLFIQKYLYFYRQIKTITIKKMLIEYWALVAVFFMMRYLYLYFLHYFGVPDFYIELLCLVMIFLVLYGGMQFILKKIA